MKFNRSLGLLLAGTAFVSVANAAFALDGNDVLAKINAISAPSGISFSAASTSVDGDTVTLSGTTMTVKTADNQVVPLGDISLEGVTEEDGSYEIEKASFGDINLMDKGNGISAEDIYLEGLSVPAAVEPGTLDSLLLAKSFHVGPTKFIADNKDVASIEEVTANYTVADDESKIDMDAAVSGLKIDLSKAPDPKAQETIQALGLQNLNGQVAMKGVWTLNDGKMDITEYSFDFENVGRLDINMSLSGYTLQFIKGLQDAVKAAEANPDKAAGQQAMGMAMSGLMSQLTYNGASVRFDDAGITSKVLDYAGKQQGVDGTQFAQSLKAMVPMMIAQMNVPELQAQISNAVNAYLDDPKSLEVSAEPAQPLPFPQIMGGAMGNPVDLVKTLNVQVNANQ